MEEKCKCKEDKKEEKSSVVDDFLKLYLAGGLTSGFNSGSSNDYRFKVIDERLAILETKLELIEKLIIK
jgi:hypothetical protein